MVPLRNRNIMFRVSKSEFEKIKQNAEKNELTVSEFCRNLALSDRHDEIETLSRKTNEIVNMFSTVLTIFANVRGVTEEQKDKINETKNRVEGFKIK